MASAASCKEVRLALVICRFTVVSSMMLVSLCWSPLVGGPLVYGWTSKVGIYDSESDERILGPPRFFASEPIH